MQLVICCLLKEIGLISRSKALLQQGFFVLALMLLSACSGPADRQPLDENARVLAFGDSLTFGTGVARQDAYPRVLETLIGRSVVTSGVPGETSSEGLRRLKSVLGKNQYDLVILCHGGNDILRRLPASTTEKNIRQMIDMSSAHGAEVLLVAVPGFGLFPKPADYYEDIESSMDVIVEWDILSTLEADVSRKSDQVHFNKQGYADMAEAIAALLADEGLI